MAAGAVAALLVSTVGVAATPNPVPTSWRKLQRGVEYAQFELPNPLGIGDGRLHVVRVDPRAARLEAVLASELGGKQLRASEWCERRGLSVAINMGMFRTDGLTNVGYLRSGARTQNGRWNHYRAVLCVGPRHAGDPPLRWLDLSTNEGDPAAGGYDVVVQNLRLIRFPGRSCWGAGAKRWSEAAVAMDAGGRLLFLFARSPLSMDEFNRAILRLPLRVVRAMHVEGGPEASLSIHGGGVDLDLCGSYETGFNGDDSNQAQWPIPNVLGVRRGP